jgi:hypothetical protein
MKKLTIRNINGKDYTLELNRDSIKWLEANGFSLDNFLEKPITYYDLLWTSLFLKNYRDIQGNPNLAIKIMETYEKSGKNPSKVVKFAVDEYKAFMNALSDIDSTENDEELEITEA